MNSQGFFAPEGYMPVHLYGQTAYQPIWPPPVPQYGPGGFQIPGYPYPGYMPPVYQPWGYAAPPPTPIVAPVATPATTPAATPVTSRISPGLQFEGRPNGIPAGQNYLFPKHHTTLQILADGHDPVTQPAANFQFTKFRVPTNITLEEVITQLGVLTGAPDKCGIMEVIEQGDGTWVKGITVFQKDDKRKKTLAQVGWDETRKERTTPAEKGPVWVRLLKG